MIEIVINLNADNNHWLKTICGLFYNEISSVNTSRQTGTGLLQARLHRLIDLSGDKKIISGQKEIANYFKQLLNKHFKEGKLVEFSAAGYGDPFRASSGAEKYGILFKPYFA